MLAQRMVENGSLYTDAWLAGPPVLVWIYYAFVKVFGSYALIALRISTCIYIYISAIYFNGLILEHKIFRNYTGLKTLLFAMLVSLPWYAQEVSSSLFVLLPITISFHAFSLMGEDRVSNYGLMFQSGIWMMLCILTTYKAVFILFGLLVAYVWLKRSRADEFISLIGGMTLTLLVVLSGLFFNSALADFWDVGVLFYLDRIRLDLPGIYNYDTLSAIYAWSLLWAPVMILGVIGFAHFRVRFFSYVTKIRGLELSMAVWLVGVILVLIFKFRRLELSDFILLVPPLSFYAGKIFDFKLAYRLRVFLVLIVLAVPFYQYLTYFGIIFPNAPNAIKLPQTASILHGGFMDQLKGAEPIPGFQPKKEIKNGIWIMEFNPWLYQKLAAPIPNKYTDFRIAYFKFPEFEKPDDFALVSKMETDRDIYRAFTQNPPEYIIDSNDYFPSLANRFPGVFANYQKQEYGKYSVYEWME